MTLLMTLWRQLEGILIYFISAAVLFLPFNTTLTNISSVAAAVTSILIYLKNKQPAITLATLPVIFFPLFLISLLISKDTEVAISWLETGASFVYIPMIFTLSESAFTPRAIKRILIIFVAGILSYCLYHYLLIAWTHGQFSPPPVQDNYTYHEPFSRYAFAGSYPVYISVFVLFALAIVFEKITKNKVVMVLSILVSAFFLIILSSKNQLIVFLPIVCFLLWKHVHTGVWMKITVVIIILTTVIVLAAKNGQIRYRFVKEFSTSEGDRFLLWNAAMQTASENLFYGVGTGDRSWALQQKLAVKNEHLANTYNSAHNQYLDFLVAFGLFGLIFYFLVLCAPIVLKAETLLIILVIIVAATSMTESFLFRQKGLSFFLLFYGLLGSRYKLFSKTNYAI